MDGYLVQGSNDFMVPIEQYELDDWFHWGLIEYEKDGFSQKFTGTSEKEKPTNLNCDTRLTRAKESKVPQVPLVEASTCSSAHVDSLMTDSGLQSSDDLFQDLLDFETQNRVQSMDNIFLNSFLEEDVVLFESPSELVDTTNSMLLPWNLRMTALEDMETLTKGSTSREDTHLNVRAAQPAISSPATDSTITAVVSEPLCMEEAVLQELENVMLELSSQTRTCIRDGLYRLATRSKEQRINLCQSEMTLDLSSSASSLICSAHSRREQSKSLEPKTNLIDRTIASLLFCMPENGAAC